MNECESERLEMSKYTSMNILYYYMMYYLYLYEKQFVSKDLPLFKYNKNSRKRLHICAVIKRNHASVEKKKDSNSHSYEHIDISK